VFYFATYLPILCNYFSIGSILALSVSTTRRTQFPTSIRSWNTIYWQAGRIITIFAATHRDEMHWTPRLCFPTRQYKPTPAHHAMETVQLLQQKMSLFSSRQRNCCRLTTMQTGMKLNIVPDASVIAKFHYTDTDTDPNGPNGVSPQKSPCPCPCRARVGPV